MIVGEILKGFKMLKVANEEMLGRVLYNLVGKKEREEVKLALLAIMGVPSREYPQNKTNSMHKRFIVFYLNRMESFTSERTQDSCNTGLDLMSTKYSSGHKELLQKICEACGQTPTLTDIFAVMKKINISPSTPNNLKLPRAKTPKAVKVYNNSINKAKKDSKHKADSKNDKEKVGDMKKDKVAILELEVNIDEVSEKCVIYKGDTPQMIIQGLTRKYNLNEEEQKIIFEQLKNHF
eukprot:TRINITY_DN18808_c0_g2_i2.p1 TRINITY_DN18808_c0_g2~~TRINITY_DN18808_c0_g2_i2.p1  ORF type:complete len:236 (-),score=36.23 TRINITY_DN18808_c0_g2_i2:148-855(-)